MFGNNDDKNSRYWKDKLYNTMTVYLTFGVGK